MSDSVKKERKTLRSRCTKLINLVEQNIENLNVNKLKSHIITLDDYLIKLKSLDYLILDDIRADDSVSENDLEKLESECDDYYSELQSCKIFIEDYLKSLSNDTRMTPMSGITSAPSGHRIHLPNINLPEFHADENKIY